MDSRKVEALLKKYWKGDTNQLEELELKKYFGSKKGSSEMGTDYFNYLSSKSDTAPLDMDFDERILNQIKENPTETKVKIISRKYWFAAASIVVLLSIGIIFKSVIIKEDPPVQLAQVDTYDDPQKAFEETKKALLFLSSKLNVSSDYATQISKFEKSQEIIKQN